MTYIDEAEVRRPSRGTKVLGFGFAILAVLGSFWGIVWFIRSYVEPPRVLRPSPLALAAPDSTLVSPAQTKRIQQAQDKTTTASPAASADVADRGATTGAIADRWAPLSQAAPATTQTAPASREAVPATSPPMGPPSTIAATPATLAAADPAPLPTISAATSLTTLHTAPDPEALEEVVLSFTPAIRDPAPLPRRRPVMTASAAKRNNAEPPLPRPRPDGPAPQSVFTPAPVSDDRFPTQ
jgi:cytoskeletal protein RodZ